MNFLAQTHEGAKAELAKIDAQIADLTNQRERLQVILDATGAITTTAHERFNKSHPGLTRPPMSDVIATDMWGRTSFRIADAVASLERYGWPLTANKSQIVRNTLLRRGDLFQRLLDGSFRVKARDTEKPAEAGS